MPSRRPSGRPDLAHIAEPLRPLAVPLGDLSPDPANARLHDERNLEAVAGSLRRFGQQKPIVVDAKGIVIAGNATLEAARRLGWTHIAAVRTRLAGPDRTAYAIADKGIVGVGMLGEAAQFAAVHQSYVSAVETDAVVVVGPNVTVATIDRVGGSMTLQCGATTVQNAAGDLLTVGSGAIAALTVDGGTVVSNSSGTVTTLNANGGTADFTRSRAARTVTTPKIQAGATIKYDPAVVTFTNKVEAVGPVSLAAQAA